MLEQASPLCLTSPVRFTLDQDRRRTTDFIVRIYLALLSPDIASPGTYDRSSPGTG